MPHRLRHRNAELHKHWVRCAVRKKYCNICREHGFNISLETSNVASSVEAQNTEEIGSVFPPAVVNDQAFNLEKHRITREPTHKHVTAINSVDCEHHRMHTQDPSPHTYHQQHNHRYHRMIDTDVDTITVVTSATPFTIAAIMSSS